MELVSRDHAETDVHTHILTLTSGDRRKIKLDEYGMALRDCLNKDPSCISARLEWLAYVARKIEGATP